MGHMFHTLNVTNISVVIKLSSVYDRDCVCQIVIVIPGSEFSFQSACVVSMSTDIELNVKMKDCWLL